jgi:peptide deformylase
MAILPILVAPDPILKAKAAKVEAVDDAVRALMDDMLETMYEAPGIGLAAPQVGVSRRIVVLDVAGKDEPPAPMFLVNPEVVWESEDLSTYEEGCLSVPKQYAAVERPARVWVRFLDRDGSRARSSRRPARHLCAARNRPPGTSPCSSIIWRR